MPTLLSIPTELRLRILSHLPPAQLFHNARLISHDFRALANDTLRKTLLPQIRITAQVDMEEDRNLAWDALEYGGDGEDVPDLHCTFQNLSSNATEVRYALRRVSPSDMQERAVQELESGEPIVYVQVTKDRIYSVKEWRTMVLAQERCEDGHEVVWSIDWRKMMACVFKNGRS